MTMVNKPFANIITFTRASGGGRFNSSGVYEWVGNNVPRIDYGYDVVTPARTNLLTYSEQFDNAAWSKTGTTTTANAVLSPDGTVNADKFVEDTSNSSKMIFQGITIAAGSTQTLTVFAKAAERSVIRLQIADTSTTNGVVCAFDLSAGTIQASDSGVAVGNGTFIGASITPVGNGWYRCQLTGSIGAGITTARLTYRLKGVGTQYAYVGDGVSGLYIWGAQLETGVAATEYIPTEATSVTVPAVLELNPRGILIEEQRTNLLTYSAQIGNAVWSKGRAGVGVSLPVAGLQLATLTATETNTNGFLVSQTVASTSTTALTFSVVLKKGASDWAIVVVSDGAALSGVRQWVNTSTGALGTSTTFGTGWTKTSATVEQIAAETYRVSFSVAGSGTNARVLAYPSVSANGAFNCTAGDVGYLGAAQLEVGSFPTSHIPTPATFTSRASTATYFDSNGVLQTAAIDTARYDHRFIDGQWKPTGLLLEGAATNLLLRSSEFSDANWTKSGAYVIPNTTVSPDGSVNADSVVTTGVNSTSPSASISAITSAGVTYTYSVWMRADTPQTKALQIPVPSFASYLAQKSVTLTTAWQRFDITFTGQAGALWIRSSAIGESFEIWGAQLEAGASPTSHISTPSVFTSRASTATYFDSNGVLRTAAANEARYDHRFIGGVWKPTGLMLESATTNLLLRSSEFDNAYWGRVGVTISANSVTGLDGLISADTMIESNAFSQHLIASSTLDFTAGVTYSAFVYAKAAGRSILQHSISGGTGLGGQGYANFDLVNGIVGSVGAGVTAKMVPVGDGWYLCAVSFTAATTGSGAHGLFLQSTPSAGRANSYEGDGTSGIYIWGAQLEVGSSPTSYIPTETSQVTRAADVSTSSQVTRAADVSTSSQVTRAADVASVNTLSPWYNASEGALFVESARLASLPANTPLALFQGDGVNNIRIRADAAGYIYDAYNNGSIIASLAPPAGQNNKVAVVYKDNYFNVSSGGLVATPDTSGIVPAVNALLIGRHQYNGNRFNGHIRSLSYWPRRLSNAEISALTAP